MAKGSKSFQRRISKESRYAIQQWGASTAEMLWAWNRLQSAQFELFLSFLDESLPYEGPKFEAAKAIWHTFQSDKSQREMLRDVASAALPPKSVRLKQIKWLIKTIDRIAPFRNAVVHIPIIFREIEKGEPNALYLDEIGARDNAVRRLSYVDSASFWDCAAGDLFVLGSVRAVTLYARKAYFVG